MRDTCDVCHGDGLVAQELCAQCADEHDRLRAEVERLRAALEEIKVIPPSHAAKLPCSSYHVLMRVVGSLSESEGKNG